MINIPFVKAPYAKKLLILTIVSICFRVITYFIQQPYTNTKMAENILESANILDFDKIAKKA